MRTESSKKKISEKVAPLESLIVSSSAPAASVPSPRGDPPASLPGVSSLPVDSSPSLDSSSCPPVPVVIKKISRRSAKAVPGTAAVCPQAQPSLSLCGGGLGEGRERSAYDVLKDIQEVTRQAFAGGDIRTALKGLEMEAKHMGMLEDKIDAKVSIRTWMDCIARDEQFTEE